MELNINWKYIPIGIIANVTKLAGFEFTKYIQYVNDGEIIAVRGLNLKSGKLVLNDIKKMKKEISQSLLRSKLNKNDICFSYVGTIGQVGLIEQDEKYHLGPNVAKITILNKKILPYFILLFFLSPFIRKEINKYKKQMGQPSLSMENLRKIEVILPFKNNEPDLEEQKRIIDKIDKLFLEIDKGIEKIKTSLKIVNVFMQSVLRNTFINHISFNYRIVEFNDAIDKNINFSIGKIKKEMYLNEGKYPIIDQGQELIGGFSNYKDLVFTGDVPLIIYGDHTQIIKYIDFKFIQGADGIKLLFPNKNTNCRFLYYLLETFKPIDNKYARHYKELKKLKFPIPYKNSNFDLEEQKKIARRLDTIFNSSKDLQNKLKSQLNNFELLKQSILNGAFQGKL